MRWLLTGGAGFIGTNLATHLLKTDCEVVLVDDLSRSGSEDNAALMQATYGLSVNRVDITDTQALFALCDSLGQIDAIAHLAGQVSFLESISEPARDFQVNAVGTLNVLEWVRKRSPQTPVIGMSSNKVYGDLEQVRYVEDEKRYRAPDWPLGFDESLPLNLRGPYGCSKGVADQYLAEYGRTYGLRTASLRQSSVYGLHQHPRSDQGWVAHLIEFAAAGRTIQLNGVGKQVRDLLHASDLARLFPLLAANLESGKPVQANVGGGPANALSILELFDWLRGELGRPVEFMTGEERPSDQRIFVSDNTRIEAAAAWAPTVTLPEGLSELLLAVKS